VNRLMEWSALRQQYSRRAQTQARTYTSARMAAQYSRLYADLIGSRMVSSAKEMAVASS
jgi:hypothetical protein